MSSEKFSLKWNDFARNVSNSFSRLRQETRLYDVTLVSNDHQQVSAHKLVLSACSEVFSTIFNSNNGSNMMLYLDSVDVKELNFMLDYIYQGEVEVQQEYLDRFIEVATKFKLSGILTTQDEEREEGKYYHVEKEETPVTLHETIENEYMHLKIDTKKNLPQYQEESSFRPIDQIYVENVAEIDQKFAELIEKDNDGLHRCTVCEKKVKDKRDMKRHLETHLSGLSYDCSQCGKNFRSSSSLRRHTYHHSVKNYS